MESEPKKSQPGRLLSNRFDNAPRELSPIARWLDIWQRDSVAAIGKIVDMGDRDMPGSRDLHSLLAGEELVIPLEQFEESALEWLRQSPHSWYQYEELFRGLEIRDGFLCPKVLEWFLDNLETLYQIPGPPHAGWSNLMEQLEGLKQGKSFDQLRREFIEKRRAASQKPLDD